MDLNQAIQKHAEWKLKFRTAITRRETMDVATIGKDYCCELGNWLHGDAARRYGSLPTYLACVSRHAVFHTEAGKVAQAINARRFAEAEAMINGDSAYSAASSEVGAAIMRLKKEAGL